MRIVEIASFTEAGGRPTNEDALLELEEIPLFAVADGMGQDGAGTYAAQIAVDQVIREADGLQELFQRVAEDRTTTSRLRVVESFDSLFNTAGRRVQREAEDRQAVGMATTLLVSSIVGQTAYLAHVGDSRAYLLREGRLLRLTEDHSVAEFRYRRGRMTREEYIESPDRHVLYQAVGSGPEVDVDLAEVRLADGDVLLLCTDGLIRAVDESAVSEALAGEELTESLGALREAASAKEAPDNLTAIAIRLGSDEGDSGIREVTDAMGGCFLFSQLTEPERLVVAPYVEEVTYQRGDVITATDGPADHLGIVIEGLVREEWLLGDHQDLPPGRWFGAAGLAGAGNWRRRRTALETTRVLVFSKERFRELVRYKPDLGARMATALADELRDQLKRGEQRLERVYRALT